MAGKAKFDKESAFRAIVGEDQQADSYEMGGSMGQNEEKANRVQRSYYLDRDIEKALKKKALEEEKKLTETINEVLRKGLEDYL